MPLQKAKSMQTKSKSKKQNGKLGKEKLPTRSANSTISPDLSSLRKPIDTSLSALYQVSKLLENGTDEVKSILSYECDIVYECRICRSLFRSIVNLISHKREYCREKYNIALHRSVLDDFNVISNGSIIHKAGETIIKDSVKNDRILRSQVPKERRKRDLSTIVDTLNKKREENIRCNFSSESKVKTIIPDAPNNQFIYLEPIDTNNSAVYQTVRSLDTMDDTGDSIKGQILELQNMMDQHTVILGATDESQLEKSDSPIQVDTSDEENKLSVDRPSTTNSFVCTICNAKFSTKKTLIFHLKTLHTSQRVCYQCPCCTTTFANAWSVCRHLYKVHRQNNEQVRELRSHIQEKAFHIKRNNIKTAVMEALAKARATQVPASENVAMRNSDKTREWVYQSEFDGELRNSTESCVRCGKKFERKAALSGHSQYCQAPNGACREIATQIRRASKTLSSPALSDKLCQTEDIDVVTDTISPAVDKETLDIDSGRTSSSPEMIDENHETSICVQTISSLSKEDWDMLDNHHNYSSECNSTDNNNDHGTIAPSITRNINGGDSLSTDDSRDHFESNTSLRSREIVCASTSETSFTAPKTGSKRGQMSSQHDEKRLTDLEEKDITEVQEDSSVAAELQPSCSIRPSKTKRTSLMENKIATIANLRKLQCLLCKRKFTSMTNLRRHLAIHMGWNRYRCKLCDFKCFVKCDCIAHCNKVHNAQNNRATIADIMVEILQNECNNKDVIDITDAEQSTDEPEIVDITASSSSRRSKTHKESSDSSDANTRVALDNEAATTGERQRVVTESRRDVEHEIVEERGSGEATMTQDLAKYMTNCESGRLNAHPDIKRMIMEVIFGSNYASTTEQQTNFDKLASGTTGDDVAGRNVDANDNENDTASVDEPKKTSHSISDSSKSQRPTRNRIKPLNEDFVYNLKEKTSLRKDDGLSFKEPSLHQLGKSLTKHGLHLCDSETLSVRKKAKWYN